MKNESNTKSKMYVYIYIERESKNKRNQIKEQKRKITDYNYVVDFLKCRRNIFVEITCCFNLFMDIENNDK